ncbi:MAG: hypothetical protein JWO91_560 [Acidobacteriaceae bacterium]|jgi:hypothetical protein|nr:hypothetical protein [Acidobacteriaceae bacterium]
MRINKTFIIVGLMIAFALFFELAAHADEGNEATKLTFNQPIQIPGRVLPAGTYFFKLVHNDSDQHMVQILNGDQTTVYATLQTVATERPDATDDTALAFAEQGPGKPDVLLKWFYPGRLTGNEFVYSKQTEKNLAQDKQQVVEANQPALSNSDTTGTGN